jgi:hypothetical protein
MPTLGGDLISATSGRSSRCWRPVKLAAPVDSTLMISSIGSAMTGMASAMRRFDRASADIASAEPGDPVRDRVEQIVAQHDVAANAATIRTADDMLGTLIDTLA